MGCLATSLRYYGELKMNLGAYIRSRARRGWSLKTLGPNEARVLFDAGLAFAASLAATGFLALFARPSSAVSLNAFFVSIGALPVLFVAFNALVGVYTR